MATTSSRYQGNIQPSMGISSLQYQGKRVTGMGIIADGGGVSLEVWNYCGDKYIPHHVLHKPLGAPLNGMLPGEYTRTQYMIRNLLKL